MKSEAKDDLGLPWKLVDYGRKVYRVVDSDERESEYVFYNEAYYSDAPDLEVAAYIVKAVNHHEALVEALGEAVKQIDYLHTKFKPTGSGAAVISRSNALLASLE